MSGRSSRLSLLIARPWLTVTALSLAYLPARAPARIRLPDDLEWLFTVVRPTVIPWTSLDGFTLHWVILAIMVQRGELAEKNKGFLLVRLR